MRTNPLFNPKYLSTLQFSLRPLLLRSASPLSTGIQLLRKYGKTVGGNSFDSKALLSEINKIGRIAIANINKDEILRKYKDELLKKYIDENAAKIGVLRKELETEYDKYKKKASEVLKEVEKLTVKADLMKQEINKYKSKFSEVVEEVRRDPRVVNWSGVIEGNVQDVMHTISLMRTFEDEDAIEDKIITGVGNQASRVKDHHISIHREINNTTSVRGIPYYSDRCNLSEFNLVKASTHPHKQKLNVYFPEGMVDSRDRHHFDHFNAASDSLNLNSGGKPIVIHIHGGGWQRGDRNMFYYGAPFMARGYAQAGFIGVSISYRLAGNGVQHPDQVEDVARAIRWVYDNASGLGGDVNRVYLSGHSAGAHLASLVTLYPKFLRKNGLDVGLVKGVVGISGIYSLFNSMSGELSPNWKDIIFEKSYVRPAFGTDQHTWFTASPVHHVDLFPPKFELPSFILINAAHDLGLENIAIEFYSKLASRGFKVSHHIVPAASHGSVTHSQRTMDLAVQFVNECK